MEILNFKGPLSDLIHILKKGGSIHIKKKNRGKFTEYCGGKVTEECIAKGKKSKDPKIRKRATFADNARKWKHATGGPLRRPNFKESKEAYYDPETDTVFAPDSLGEFYHHEMFHARPNTQLLESLKPYYHNLNDDVLKQMGADLSFVKRFNNDPGHFYSPEELGARTVSASEMLKKMGVKDVTLDFLKNARLNENAYGDNFRDLLHMYNDKNLMEIFNIIKKHKNGGIIKYQNPSSPLINRVNKSKANFVKRLLDPNRKSIQNWVNPLSISTHKLGWATEDTKQGAFVYPEVQEIDGELIDFTHPSHLKSEGMNSAIERRDTVRMTPEQAKWFTENYKQYYPGFQNGGNLYSPQPLSPLDIALNQARAMAKMKGEQHLPPGVKEIVGPDGKKIAIRTEQPLVPLEQSIAEWLPGTGDVAEVGYIANDVKNGNLGSAALAAAMVALPGNVGKVFRKSDVPTSKLTEAERLGIPKGERSNPKALGNPQYWGYEQWNERYNKAIEEWDLDELQRLRDLHFITKAPGTQVITESGMPQRVYHFTSRRKPVQIFTKGSDTYPTPMYFTSNRDGLLTHDPYNITDMHPRHVRGDYYMKMENPLKEVPESAVRDYWGNYEFNELKKILRRDPSMSESIINYYRDRINGLLKQTRTAHRSGNQLLENDLFNKIEDLGIMLRKHISRDLPTKQSKIYGLLGREGVGFEDLMKSELNADGIIHNVGPTQHYITYDPEVIKSAEPVMYDDFGNIIPIVKRDNFRNLDTRYKKGGKL